MCVAGGAQATWAELIGLATQGMVDLCAEGWYQPPMPPTAANPGMYFVWCAACTTVEIDVLTGEVEVRYSMRVSVCVCVCVFGGAMLGRGL